MALGVLALAVLAVPAVVVRTLDRAPGAPPGRVPLHLAASNALEKVRLHLYSRADGFASAVATFDGRTLRYDASGEEIQAGEAAVECRLAAAWVPVAVGPSRVVRVSARATDGGAGRVDLAVLLAPPPPESHVVYSGYLAEDAGGPAHWDDYWGGYYGFLFGKRQATAYEQGLLEDTHAPLPADPAGAAAPPAQPSPVPWGWR